MTTSPHWTVNGWRKMILSEQVEAWLILSVSQLALACLLKFVQTCELLEHVFQEISALTLAPHGHDLYRISFLQ